MPNEKISYLALNLIEASNGMKSDELMTKLMVSFLAASKNDVDDALELLVLEGKIRRINYTINNGITRSFFLPGRSSIEFK